MVYFATRSKLSVLLVVVGVCSVSGYGLDKVYEKNFPSSMKNDVKSLITEIYAPGEAPAGMATAIKKGRDVVTFRVTDIPHNDLMNHNWIPNTVTCDYFPERNERDISR